MAESWCNFVKFCAIFAICINFCIPWSFNTYIKENSGAGLYIQEKATEESITKNKGTPAGVPLLKFKKGEDLFYNVKLATLNYNTLVRSVNGLTEEIVDNL